MRKHSKERKMTMAYARLILEDIVEVEKQTPYGLSTKEWAAIQKALKIDPKTAICEAHYTSHGDPYLANKNIPDECKALCPNDYARSPGSNILVCFEDLPKRIRVALYKRLEKEAAEARRSRDGNHTVVEVYEI